jgi:hypothetical protein
VRKLYRRKRTADIQRTVYCAGSAVQKPRSHTGKAQDTVRRQLHVPFPDARPIARHTAAGLPSTDRSHQLRSQHTFHVQEAHHSKLNHVTPPLCLRFARRCPAAPPRQMLSIDSSKQHFSVLRASIESTEAPSGVIVHDKFGRQQRTAMPTAASSFERHQPAGSELRAAPEKPGKTLSNSPFR